MMKVAVIGEGVIGTSSALALLKRMPKSQITIFHDKPFEESCSAGPAGLFRIDQEKNRDYGYATFQWFASLYKERSGEETGVKLISGHIQSDNKETLLAQERAYGDIVYNFRWLTDRELQMIFPEPSKYAIHYTAYASEGNLYVPFLKSLLLKQGVKFEQRLVKTVDELSNEFDVIINCAGNHGGEVAGDGDNAVVPTRGVVIEVDASWHKHFNYRDFSTFTIPKNNSVVIGTVRQTGRLNDWKVSDADRKEILDRYFKLQPTIKDAKVLREWVHYRPERSSIRIEAVEKSNKDGKNYTVIHHYGHGSNGFTLGWGTSLKVAEMVQNSPVGRQHTAKL